MFSENGYYTSAQLLSRLKFMTNCKTRNLALLICYIVNELKLLNDLINFFSVNFKTQKCTPTVQNCISLIRPKPFVCFILAGRVKASAVVLVFSRKIMTALL